MWKTIFVDIFILYVPQLMFMNMDINLTYNLTEIEEGRIRITISVNESVELGTLYFEKAKRLFQRKPIGMDAWACVDAKIEGLYQIGGESITPKDIVKKCQDLIKERGY
jgi:hypothetical protein